MNAFDEFACAQNRLIENKYSAIYRKRDEILEFRQQQMSSFKLDPNTAQEDNNVQQLKTMLTELGGLEHELALLQRETYHVLEKHLKLDELKIFAVFPRWEQEESRPHTRSMVSSVSFPSLSDIPSTSSSTAATTPTSLASPRSGGSTSYSSTPGYSYSKNKKVQGVLSLDVPSAENKIKPGIPSPLPDDVDLLREEIRRDRAKLLPLKKRKYLNDKERATKLLLESQIKEAERKHEFLVHEQEVAKRRTNSFRL